ncbi:uncharacterized protein PHALS_11631 [Plasmopara halstedii]|uniref:RxLR-like protein n=1 Tax=Plasmopara halstedii TaxID=4781 RepID=A0A0P1AK43_PLAHL|nr:uncharacterized protein PHALS_11631 [Plasmopara halstedii]CEG41273.1 hypothetical protein PHALS_11631 [Plasmopara halstedii]|eukprot:XP_024577642.1 hypothetical protein PHALS_11631 [Plasmopara halstedii]
MKFSSILAFEIAVKIHLVAAQVLTITTDDCSSCPTGTYCTRSNLECRGPPFEGLCFNATISEYQVGCEEGYDCFDNMCECVIEDPSFTTSPTINSMDTPTIVSSTMPSTIPSPTIGSNLINIHTPCPTGTYYELGATACRGPRYATECYNPATAMYQNGCALGFQCINNKCSTIPPSTFPPSVCYQKCTETNEYCENGTNFCRGPKYAGECFNPATGLYQNGCDGGYKCNNNICV